jgi:hypothetical protein
VLFMQYAKWGSKLIPVAWNALQRLRLGDAVDCPLKRNTRATGGIFESTRCRPVLQYASPRSQYSNDTIPLSSGILPFPRIRPAALASCLSPFGFLIPLSFASKGPITSGPGQLRVVGYKRTCMY